MHKLLPLPFFHVWVYLQTQPLLGLAATLCAWEVAALLDQRAGHKAYSNPTVLAVAMLVAALLLTGTSYQTYFSGAVYIHFLLGPATVALAVPMYANWPAIRRNFVPILVSLGAGSLVAALSAMLIAKALGAPHEVVMSLGPKSVTTPIAMGVAQQLGGLPALTAVFVIITGLFGTLICGPLYKAARVRAWEAQGLAAGTAAHGIATAHMIRLNETAGAFGGLAIGLNGIVTAIIVPLLVALLPL
ncbi:MULTISPECIES: LrgB family protein [Acidocella]|uniref:LrgB family protein n=1 Tax=Acidocella TaxID=50709 RepID=UPI00028DF724|nr:MULTISPECIES: LrgB family protein [Acidocella]EKM99676.1 LrgB-like protein [Acidocella sp. MX-AZ02]WBO58305.1 LrgB family protein [Acidocella sp. MX-AZ03]